jgi:hypothetical protein
MPKHEKPLHLDMSFDEALRRYAQTDPRELPVAAKKKRKRVTAQRAVRKSAKTSPPPLR